MHKNEFRKLVLVKVDLEIFESGISVLISDVSAKGRNSSRAPKFLKFGELREHNIRNNFRYWLEV